MPGIDWLLMGTVDYDDVIKYNLFSALLALREGNPPVIGGFPSQGTLTRSFCSAPEQTVEQTLETQVIGNAIALITVSL